MPGMQDVGRFIKRRYRAKYATGTKKKYQSVREQAGTVIGSEGKERIVLKDPKKMAQYAKAKSTRAFNKELLDMSKPILDPLKISQIPNVAKSMIGMARKYAHNPMILKKLEQMDTEKMFRLMDSNDLLLEVFFSYHVPPEQMGTGMKDDDFWLFINEYERIFGTIEVGAISYGDFE